MPKLITVIIRPDATVEVATSGFTGGACKAASAAYEKALGTVQSDTPTPEARLPEATDAAKLRLRTGG